MYISRIEIKNYRNFKDFSMDFTDGLNVIVGANNSGKTGLLKAISLLSNPSQINEEDFNKNDLKENFNTVYKESAPEISIKYYIQHEISEDDTDDEGILKLLAFLSMDEIQTNRDSAVDHTKYTVSACVKAKYILNPKKIAEYKAMINNCTDFTKFFSSFKLFQKYYSWVYTNGTTETTIDYREACKIFKINFIEAERNSEAVYNETRRELEKYIKNTPECAKSIQEIEEQLSKDMKGAVKPVLDRIKDLVIHEDNEIGLHNGNIAIEQDMRPSTTISSSYVIDVKDTRAKYTLPISHNGLGYNNLINMYMLVKLVEIHRGKDFKILCLEEPEAHLHPAMQYKLFKFLKKMDEENDLKQQIFVTTHSPNITAVAGLDNIYMMAYCREEGADDCKQQSLKLQLKDNKRAKDHLMKFLDVTRSDMLFADKIILVEGIAEKLLMPKFMEKCDFPYEDEHVSIVEVGGKNFSNFIPVFAGNTVEKKVLCITDCDFNWENKGTCRSREEYRRHEPDHISSLRKSYGEFDNVKVVAQSSFGSTFEDELFWANIGNEEVQLKMLKKALPSSLETYIDKYKLNYADWINNIEEVDGRSKEKLDAFIKHFEKIKDNSSNDALFMEKLFFAKLFYSYAESKKGDFALSLLVDDELIRELIVPDYIMEGIKWLK